MDTKTCSKCKIAKPIEDFRLRKGKQKGQSVYRSSACRSCECAYSVKNAKQNRCRVNEWWRRDYYANPEKWSLRQKGFYEKHKERIKERSRRYYSNNKNRVEIATRKWRNANIDKVKGYKRKSSKSWIDHLSDGYLKQLLKRQGWPKSVLNDKNLLSLKKTVLNTKRKFKNTNNEKVQKTKKSK